MTAKALQLAKRYQRTLFEIERFYPMYRAAAFENPIFPIVTHDQEIQYMEWGLIPRFMYPKNDSEEEKQETVRKALELRRKLYNARQEGIFEKPSYRDSIRKRRCIIPSTGFYEYHYDDKKIAIPYYIFVKSEKIFSIAGIWDEWVNPLTGEIIQTFSLITTKANSLLAEIHNGGKNPFRMPLIIHPEDEERWLDPDLPEEDILAILDKDFTDKDLETYPIDKNDFRKLSPDDPGIIRMVK